MINPDWFSICKAYAELKGITEERAVLLSILLFTNRDIGVLPLPESYGQFTRLLEGKKPFPGRWVKSEEKRKTKGTARPDNDPTEYTWEQFWSDYGYKKSIKESKSAFSKLCEADRIAIRDTVHIYVAETPDPKYRLHASTYINKRKWEDYANLEKREISIPDTGEFRADFINYRAKTKIEHPTLPENYLLNYKEYSNLRTESWKSEFKTNVGTSVLKSIVEQAHQKSLTKGGLVYDNFIQILKSKV